MERLKYLSVKNVTQTTADIYFYGDIVGDEWSKWCDTDTCPDDVIKALREADGKDINVYINSPGGSVFAGVAIYNMLKRHTGKKTCYVDGLAASIASIILMAGKIKMPSNGMIMIHKPICALYGNADEMRKMADDLDIIQLSLEEAYKSKLKNPEDIEKIKELMTDETWLTATKAAEYFDIEIIEENKAVAKVDLESLKNYKNVPDILNKTGNKLQEDIDEALIKAELELMSL